MAPSLPATPAERLAEITSRMEAASRRFPLLHAAPRLVAVSKTMPADAIAPVLAAGQRVFGENRVQEAQGKWPELKAQYPDVSLHLIGPLQTNKVKEAVALFDVIETLDRDRLAVALKAEMVRQGVERTLFVQVNIGQEAQKGGISPAETVAFVERCRTEHGLNIAGLMCIPPADVPPGPYFAQLALLGRQARVSELSMGMSADFETAIGMGATYIRVGTALFGKRA